MMAGSARFEVYPMMQAVPTLDAAESEPTGEYGWRLVSANGQIVAVSGEGYTRRADAERAIGDALSTINATRQAGAEPWSVTQARIINVK